MSFEKIGLHVLRNGVKVETLATAPVLCLVDCSVEYIQEVRAANPGAWIVVRWVVKNQDAYLKDPEKGAERWFREHEGDIRAVMGPRIVFQGLNEIGSNQSAHYVTFEEHRAGLLWAIAAGFGLGAWGVGDPDWWVWEIFRRLLNGMDADDAVLLHEYWADPSDLDKRWFTGRWMDERVASAIAGQNVIITEIGRDVLWEANFRRGQPGWRRTIGSEGMLMEVSRYNDELLNPSPDVLGGCGFTDGIEGEWKEFSWKPLWPRIAAAQGKPVPPPAPVPVPTPEPLPENEPATDAETMAEKVRWWVEEAIRALELAGEPPEGRAMRILYSLTKTKTGLLYRLERHLKGYVGDHVGLAEMFRPPESER